MKTKLDLTLINKAWVCEVLEFNVRRNTENSATNVELKILENGEIRILRFLNTDLIEFENRFSHYGNNLEIANLANDGMEYVNLSVRGFIEGSGNFRFFANNLVEGFE